VIASRFLPKNLENSPLPQKCNASILEMASKPVVLPQKNGGLATRPCMKKLQSKSAATLPQFLVVLENHNLKIIPALQRQDSA
jgi:hypothetical protein